MRTGTAFWVRIPRSGVPFLSRSGTEGTDLGDQDGDLRRSVTQGISGGRFINPPRMTYYFEIPTGAVHITKGHNSSILPAIRSG
jgi:hypothetical protein